MVDFVTNIQYGKQQVCFRIYKESPGVYFAEHLHAKSESKKTPQQSITLVRGIRYWTGSSDDAHLHDLLGQAIEAHIQSQNKENEFCKQSL